MLCHHRRFAMGLLSWKYARPVDIDNDNVGNTYVPSLCRPRYCYSIDRTYGTGIINGATNDLYTCYAIVYACVSLYGSRGNRAENTAGAQGFSVAVEKGSAVIPGQSQARRSGYILKHFFYWKLKNRCPSTARKPLPTRMISSNRLSGLGRFYIFILFFIFLRHTTPSSLSAPPSLCPILTRLDDCRTAARHPHYIWAPPKLTAAIARSRCLCDAETQC